ncbi:hypothetical protein [Nostocoides australiense]
MRLVDGQGEELDGILGHQEAGLARHVIEQKLLQAGLVDDHVRELAESGRGVEHPAVRSIRSRSAAEGPQKRTSLTQ